MEEAQISVIDIGCLLSQNRPTDKEWETVAEKLRRGLHAIGFTYIVNHGMNQEKVRKQ